MLFNQIAYGPIHSRRFGCSLGINLMPADSKICTFNCIYCECGFNTKVHKPRIPTRDEIRSALQAKLEELQRQHVCPDVLTFSGNGEPTLHPDFKAIIDDTAELRDLYFPQAKVTVLTNSTQLHRPDVIDGLLKADNRLLKFDAAIEHTMRLIDQPVSEQFSVAGLIEQLRSFQGNLTIQTIFLRGSYLGRHIDNTTPEEVGAWLSALKQIRPERVMIYTIDRATPVRELEKISQTELESIAGKVRAEGFSVSVAC